MALSFLVRSPYGKRTCLRYGLTAADARAARAQKIGWGGDTYAPNADLYAAAHTGILTTSAPLLKFEAPPGLPLSGLI